MNEFDFVPSDIFHTEIPPESNVTDFEVDANEEVFDMMADMQAQYNTSEEIEYFDIPIELQEESAIIDSPEIMEQLAAKSSSYGDKMDESVIASVESLASTPDIDFHAKETQESAADDDDDTMEQNLFSIDFSSSSDPFGEAKTVFEYAVAETVGYALPDLVSLSEEHPVIQQFNDLIEKITYGDNTTDEGKKEIIQSMDEKESFIDYCAAAIATDATGIELDFRQCIVEEFESYAVIENVNIPPEEGKAVLYQNEQAVEALRSKMNSPEAKDIGKTYLDAIESISKCKHEIDDLKREFSEIVEKDKFFESSEDSDDFRIRISEKEIELKGLEVYKEKIYYESKLMLSGLEKYGLVELIHQDEPRDNVDVDELNHGEDDTPITNTIEPEDESEKKTAYEEAQEKYQEIRSFGVSQRNFFVQASKLQLDVEAYKSGQIGSQKDFVAGGTIFNDLVGVWKSDLVTSVIEIAVKSFLDKHFPAKEVDVDISESEDVHGKEEKIERIETTDREFIGNAFVDGADVSDSGYISDIYKEENRPARDHNPLYGNYMGADFTVPPDKSVGENIVRNCNAAGPKGFAYKFVERIEAYSSDAPNGIIEIKVPAMRLVEIGDARFLVDPFGQSVYSNVIPLDDDNHVPSYFRQYDISAGNSMRAETVNQGIEAYAKNLGISTEAAKDNISQISKESYVNHVLKGIDKHEAYLEKTLIPDTIRDISVIEGKKADVEKAILAFDERIKNPETTDRPADIENFTKFKERLILQDQKLDNLESQFNGRLSSLERTVQLYKDIKVECGKDKTSSGHYREEHVDAKVSLAIYGATKASGKIDFIKTRITMSDIAGIDKALESVYGRTADKLVDHFEGRKWETEAKVTIDWNGDKIDYDAQVLGSRHTDKMEALKSLAQEYGGADWEKKFPNLVDRGLASDSIPFFDAKSVVEKYNEIETEKMEVSDPKNDKTDTSAKDTSKEESPLQDDTSKDTLEDDTSPLSEDDNLKDVSEEDIQATSEQEASVEETDLEEVPSEDVSNDDTQESSDKEVSAEETDLEETPSEDVSNDDTQATSEQAASVEQTDLEEDTSEDVSEEDTQELSEQEVSAEEIDLEEVPSEDVSKEDDAGNESSLEDVSNEVTQEMSEKEVSVEETDLKKSSLEDAQGVAKELSVEEILKSGYLKNTDRISIPTWDSMSYDKDMIYKDPSDNGRVILTIDGEDRPRSITIQQVSAYLNGPIDKETISANMDKYLNRELKSTFDFREDFLDKYRFSAAPQDIISAFKEKIADYITTQETDTGKLESTAEMLASIRDSICECYINSIGESVDRAIEDVCDRLEKDGIYFYEDEENGGHYVVYDAEKDPDGETINERFELLSDTIYSNDSEDNSIEATHERISDAVDRMWDKISDYVPDGDNVEAYLNGIENIAIGISEYIEGYRDLLVTISANIANAVDNPYRDVALPDERSLNDFLQELSKDGRVDEIADIIIADFETDKEVDVFEFERDDIYDE